MLCTVAVVQSYVHSNLQFIGITPPDAGTGADEALYQIYSELSRENRCALVEYAVEAVEWAAEIFCAANNSGVDLASEWWDNEDVQPKPLDDE